MKNYQLSFFILCCILCSPLNVWGQVGSKEKKAALQVIERVYPQLRQRIKFQSLPLSEKQTDRFEQRLEDNRLIVEGSSAVALCKGTYDFIRNNSMGYAGMDVWLSAPHMGLSYASGLGQQSTR